MLQQNFSVIQLSADRQRLCFGRRSHAKQRDHLSYFGLCGGSVVVSTLVTIAVILLSAKAVCGPADTVVRETTKKS